MYNFLLTIQYIAIIVLMGDIIFLFTRKPNETQRNLLMLHVSMLITVMAYTAEIQCESVEAMRLAVKFGYIGKPLIILSVFFLVVDYCKINLPKWLRFILPIIQMGMICLVFTFEKHTLFYKNSRYNNQGLLPYLSKEHGILYNSYTVLLVLYGAFSIGICIYQASKTSNPVQRNAVLRLAGIIVLPYLGFACYLMNLTKGYDATILGYVVAAVVFSIMFSHYDQFEVVNVATDNIMQHLGLGLIVYDNNGALLHINDKAKKLDIADRIEELAKKPDSLNIDNHIYNIEKFIIKEQNIEYGSAYLITDVTSDYNYKKRLEEEKQHADIASEAKTQILSSVSQDIRTPMQTILGMTYVAEANLDNKQIMTDCLNKISVSTNHMLDIINEVLDVNKIEAGAFEIIEQPFSLKALINEIEQTGRPLAEAKRQMFKINTDTLVNYYVNGDEGKLLQILMNLLSNAIKYTNEGGKLDLTVEELKFTGDIITYRFTMQDNGIGMSPEYLDIIFDPFTRANDEVVAKAQGTGLGMAITKQFTDLLGGTISVESTLGKGSIFTVEIPFRIALESEVEIK